jgi:hypothetical protein
MSNSGVVENVVKLVGEMFLPGASGLADGDIKSGVAHMFLGVAGHALLGPVGLLLVKTNSYSYSVSNKHLHQHVMDLFVEDQPAKTNLPASDSSGVPAEPSGQSPEQ